jgi:hypothetical protein
VRKRELRVMKSEEIAALTQLLLILLGQRDAGVDFSFSPAKVMKATTRPSHQLYTGGVLVKSPLVADCFLMMPLDLRLISRPSTGPAYSLVMRYLTSLLKSLTLFGAAAVELYFHALFAGKRTLYFIIS